MVIYFIYFFLNMTAIDHFNLPNLTYLHNNTIYIRVYVLYISTSYYYTAALEIKYLNI